MGSFNRSPKFVEVVIFGGAAKAPRYWKRNEDPFIAETTVLWFGMWILFEGYRFSWVANYLLDL